MRRRYDTVGLLKNGKIVQLQRIPVKPTSKEMFWEAVKGVVLLIAGGATLFIVMCY